MDNDNKERKGKGRDRNIRNSYRIGAGCRVKRKSPNMRIEREIASTIGEASLYLYRYYSVKATEIWIDLLDDTKVGRAIGWSKRKVQYHRLRLQEHGWIYFESRIIDGMKHNHYVIYGLEKIETGDDDIDDGQ